MTQTQSTKASRRGAREKVRQFVYTGEVAEALEREAPDPRFAERRRERFFCEGEA